MDGSCRVAKGLRMPSTAEDVAALRRMAASLRAGSRNHTLDCFSVRFMRALFQKSKAEARQREGLFGNPSLVRPATQSTIPTLR